MLIPLQEFNRCITCRNYNSRSCIFCKFNNEEIGTIKQAHFDGKGLHLDIRLKDNSNHIFIENRDKLLVGWTISLKEKGSENNNRS